MVADKEKNMWIILQYLQQLHFLLKEPLILHKKLYQNMQNMHNPIYSSYVCQS